MVTIVCVKCGGDRFRLDLLLYDAHHCEDALVAMHAEADYSVTR